MKILLTLFVLLFSSSVLAETWVCSYDYNNKTKTNILERNENNKFYNIYDDGSFSSPYETYLENSNHIVLIDVIEYEDTVTTFVTHLDKKKKGFSMVGLKYSNPNKGGTDVISGECIIF